MKYNSLTKRWQNSLDPSCLKKQKTKQQLSGEYLKCYTWTNRVQLKASRMLHTTDITVALFYLVFAFAAINKCFQHDLQTLSLSNRANLLIPLLISLLWQLWCQIWPDEHLLPVLIDLCVYLRLGVPIICPFSLLTGSFMVPLSAGCW